MRIVLLHLFVFLLRLLNIPFKHMKIKNRITFISRQSDEITDDFSLIVENLKKNHTDTEVVVLCKKIGESLFDRAGYFFHMFSQMKYISTSAVVVLDGYCIAASVLSHKSRTTIIQLWHAATAVKKFGCQTIGKKSGADANIARILCMHRNYDFAVAASEKTAEFFSEGFNIDKQKITRLPMARFQRLAEDNSEKEKSMKNRYPCLKDKKNLLYIPTFRKDEGIQIEGLVDNIDFSKYNLIARLHPLDILTKRDERVLYDDVYTTYDWIGIADIIITDYSSLVVEAAITGKPLCFYDYDIEKYAADPGLNIDMRDSVLSEYVFTDGKEIIRILSEIEKNGYDTDALTSFRDKYVEVEIQNSAAVVSSFIYEAACKARM